MVAVGAVIIEILVLQQRPTRYRARRTVWDTIETKHGAKIALRRHRIFTSLLCLLLPLANFGKRAQPVATDESIRGRYDKT